MDRREFLKNSAALTLPILTGTAGLVPARAKAQDSSLTLISNVRVFDGKGDALSKVTSVLIDGDKIKEIAPNLDAPSDARGIDCGGRVLMPGLSDMHVHLIWNAGPLTTLGGRPDYLAALTLQEAHATLMRGFTSVRDTAGGVQGVARAIDEGRFPGPRIQGSHAGITMTAGHGDYRSLNLRPSNFGGPAEIDGERIGMVRSADGVPDVLAAARENFRQGANFIKMFTGGAITGLYDPLDVNEYSPEEIAAAAGEADRWNTYLAVHTYTDRSTRTALEQGALSVEHGNLMTEETMELLVEKDAWLSTQTGVFLVPLGDGFTDAQKDRQKQAAEGLDNMMTLAKQYGAKIALGADLVGSPEAKFKHVEEFTARTQWFSNAEILRQATSLNGELWAMAGPRNPYPEAKIGVIEPDAFADLLVMEGNPLEDISIMTQPDENLKIIMKDGVIYKNALS
jgi:imidazolonepropionase-like amidohydrolase